jgi:hypothetical protein
MLAACSGLPSVTSSPGLPQQSAATSGKLPQGAAALKRAASSGDLIYEVGNGGAAYIFSFPQGQLVTEFQLPSPASSGRACADSKGDVFVPSGGDEIWEYAHGGTQPIATLDDVYGYDATACSVDPSTGNLAVTNNTYQEERPGNVAIFKGAQGTPTVYTDRGLHYYDFCGFDNRGNLFINGQVQLAELPKRGNQFISISVNERVGGGPILWDGKHLTLASYAASDIYRLSVSGSTATVIGSTHLEKRKKYSVQTWIYKGAVVGPAGREDDALGIWRYPHGGKPTTTTGLGTGTDLTGGAVSIRG